jgi:hypothetical protein
VIGLLAVAATLALAVTAAVGVPRNDVRADDPRIVALEPGGAAAHHSTRADARADARRRAACRDAGFRRAHTATCPRAPRRGARSFEAQVAGTGGWSAPLRVASWPIHQIVLPTGKVLWLSPADEHEEGGRAYLWDPATQTSRRVDPPAVRYHDGVTRPANLFCSGHAALADGRVLVAGGNLAYPIAPFGPGQDFRGAPWVFTFDPWTETWTRHPDMPRGRWYPTVTTLPDGTALILSGTDESGSNILNPDVELFTPSTGTTRILTRRTMSFYPHAVVVPDSTGAGAAPGTQVLIAGPGVSDTMILNTSDGSWRDVPDLPRPRLWGAAVLMPSPSGTPTQVMLIGGSDLNVTPSAQATTVTLDLNDVAAGWRAGPRMASGRSHLNVAILPDDSLLAVGGGGGIGNGSLYVAPVFSAERLSASAGTWSGAGSLVDERTYHSTAILLPDGRVLSAGDDRASHNPEPMRRGEIYSPPYLSAGARPSIDAAPTAVRYGVPFGVALGGPAADHAVLMRPSSVTHSTDMDQRSVRLAMSGTGATTSLTSPSDPSVAPPGYYMLFAVDAAGRPSAGRWIRLDPAAPDAPAVATPGAAAAGGPAAGAARTRQARRSPLRVRAVRRTGRTLSLTLALTLPARATGRISVVPPRRAPGARRSPAIVRRVPAGRARAASVVVSVRPPRGWIGLSMPVIVRIGGRTPVTARGIVIVQRRAPVPAARVAMR